MRPLAAAGLLAALHAAAGLALSATLWHSYEDVPRWLWLFVVALAVVAGAWGYALPGLSPDLRRSHALAVACAVPVAGAALALLVGFPLALLRFGAEPVTTAAMMWAASPLLMAVAAAAVLLRLRAARAARPERSA